MNEQFPLADPRVLGVREHFERAKWFLELAGKECDATAKFRFNMAAMYSAWAIVAVMIEAAKKQQVDGFKTGDEDADYKNYKKTVTESVRGSSLIERLRIHDFHRFGLLPPQPGVMTTFVGGPIKLKPRGGDALVTVGRKGFVTQTSGDSKVDMQRPLVSSNGRFWDEDRQEYVTLEDALAIYLEGIAALSGISRAVCGDPCCACMRGPSVTSL